MFLAGFNKRWVSIAVALAVLFLSVSLQGQSPKLTEQPSSVPTGNSWSASPCFRVRGNATVTPLESSGYTPSQIKAAYNLPSSGGAGTTIAIVDAYNDPTIASDLSTFSSYFSLPAATFVEHEMSSRISTSGSWAIEISLDVEWAHAIAPQATILLVEATSSSVAALMSAVSYATSSSTPGALKIPKVVALSMSWGGSESSTQTTYDPTFSSALSSGIVCFASSGDTGGAVIWPSSSPYVVSVGGTTLNLNSAGAVTSETGWSDSGGGPSTVEKEPSYQVTYGVKGTNGYRGTPDVSYDANPSTGVLVYDSTPYEGESGWWIVGGTSAGSPQWAAIQALGLSSGNANFYVDAKSVSYPSYFRDITSGSNGPYSCGPGYDLVTGLGSPLTTNFTPATAPNSTYLQLLVNPNQATYAGGQSLSLEVSVLNQLDVALNSTLTLTVTGPGEYYYYDFQSVSVTANSVADYSFSWAVPNLGGTYVVQVGLVPMQLTAYDAAWLTVS
jgi:subtilase family serine protease